MALKVALEALTSLTNAAPTHEHFEQYFQETKGEKNDRGAAILLATNLENALQSAIERLLAIDTTMRPELFRSELSPLGTFANKIRIAQALRIFGPETRRNLDIIRAIRNAFAHAKIPITFNTEAVLDVCSFLVLPELISRKSWATNRPSAEVDAAITGKRRFAWVCENTSHNLISWLFVGPMGIANEAVKVQLPAPYDEVWARQRPLP